MKLATFETGAAADRGPELGVVTGDRIVSISRAAPRLAVDMIDLITRWPAISGQVAAIAQAAEHALALDAVHLLAPIRRPGKIFAIGLNYADHIEESKMETPAHQVWFTKASTATNGPYDPILIPKPVGFVDYEAELVAVIGAGGKHIARDAAKDAIFGYCVGNDATERMWQHRVPQWSLGKSFDSHAPFGPWITTADEVADPHALGLRALVNGQMRQNSNTAQLVFDIFSQVEHLSLAMTLEPGDLLFTGTPGGVGAAMDPRQFLKDGDRVRIEIDGLGHLDNPCATEA
jgi:ureidoglycolate lyase